jgi:unsaturated chondroitin disaccharide hydrolase
MKQLSERVGQPEKLSWLKAALTQALQKIDRLLERDPPHFLHAIKDGKYTNREPQWWTGGFWSGLLWQAYKYTGDAKYTVAAPASKLLAECFLDERFFRLHHDVGFQFLYTAVASYELTGTPEDKQIGILAGCFEMSRFVLDGRFLRAWNVVGSENNLIIDCMMNLPLLLWTSVQTGDDRFTQVAIAHADTVRNHCLRPDGSAPHIVHYDQTSAKYVPWNEGSQAYTPDSIWARGQAWAVYGFAQLSRFTGEARFAQTASLIADNYLKLLSSYDSLIPPWDFHAPANQAKDSSAASCMASGLLELSAIESLDPSRRQHYRGQAQAMVEALYTDCAKTNDQNEALLSSGTEHFPAERNVNTGLIYGDYYYLEALLKLQGQDLIYCARKSPS